MHVLRRCLSFPAVLMGTGCTQARRDRSHILRTLPDDFEVSPCSSNSEKIHKVVSGSTMDHETSIKSLRRRPRENNIQFDNDSEEGDSDRALFEEVNTFKSFFVYQPFLLSTFKIVAICI